ncbi:MAG: archaemetzincin family Zn-dependent metalloprotease [Deltaproteobacteria bacterium]|jgi:archaemetzincin
MSIRTVQPPGVIIRPLGQVSASILQHLAISVQDRCQIPCLVGEPMENPAYAQDPDREQYSCKPILQRLHRYCSPHSWRVLAVTEKDLFVPILKYVFGAAQIEGRCAVISLHRLRPQFYGDEEDEQLLLERLVKTALHELGHSLGLTHCRRRTCVMYSSTRIDDTDAKMADFCPTCRELFRWRLQGAH